MANLVPTVRETWDEWNIRGVILLSLGLQIFLILFSPLRKRLHTAMLTWSLWSAYLLADYTANFCIGLIFHRDKLSAKDNILVFWAPFLLLHLGGQDTITAFSLEDNQLWLRHLLGLVFQVVTIVYIFVVKFHGNSLWLPTMLVFFAGIIKYIERIRSMYLACMDTFRKSVMVLNKKSRRRRRIVRALEATSNVSVPDQQLETAGPNMSNNTNMTDDVELVRKGYEYFKKFRGLVVDMTYSFVERDDSRRYFLSRTPEDALTIIEVELDFIYEHFFTKDTVLQTEVGFVCRFASFISIIGALSVFFLDEKNGYSNFDIIVTYILLLGAVALDCVALLMLSFSDRTAIIGDVPIKHFLRLKKPKWSNCKKKPYRKFKSLSTNPLCRRWAGTISGYNLITHRIHESKPIKLFRFLNYSRCCRLLNISNAGAFVRYTDKILGYTGMNELLEKWKYKANNPFLQEVWEFIFLELQRKSTFAKDAKMVKRICKARGRWIIEKGDLEKTEKDKLKPYVNSNEVAFEETLIVWHIATTICYHVRDQSHHTANPNSINNHRCFSKVLSDYMLYLLAMEPAIMSAVAGIGEQRIIDIISSLAVISSLVPLSFESQAVVAHRYNLEHWFSKKLLSDSIPTRSKSSMLRDAVALAKELKALEENKRWKTVAQVWVEMLSYAAINCRPDTLVQQLSKGGQLISFVWLLMLHLGLGIRQFKKQAEDEDEHV